jgi:hypothetical protein
MGRLDGRLDGRFDGRGLQVVFLELLERALGRDLQLAPCTAPGF